MSILKKPYELTVWEDIWDNAARSYREVRVATIGSSSMIGQNRVFDPNLVRNVNGIKKLSFKMYKKYVDVVTGETVENPLYALLTNERKIKLEYDGKWYDFVIKNTTEDSTNNLLTYQLEDALVQELSKNGFNVVLDEESMNNIGDARKLAEQVLADTDWMVESETFVQTTEEPLVYITIPAKTAAHQLLDEYDDADGNFLRNGLKDITSIVSQNSVTALAFYSSCRTSPHRFQFIYPIDDLTVENGKIINKNCQYYIECAPEEYYLADQEYGFYLPQNFEVKATQQEDNVATVISNKYRGNRYSFAQKQIYSPLLKRYLGEYVKTTGSDAGTYYGYADIVYTAPSFVDNLVTNTEFKNISGWTAAKLATDGEKPIIENVFGYFSGTDDAKKFVNAIDILDNADDLKQCKPYMKLVLNDSNGNESVVLNSGPYDKRTLIKEIAVGDKYAFRVVCYTEDGQRVAPSSSLRFSFGNYVYDPNSALYTENHDLGTITFEDEGEYEGEGETINKYLIKTVTESDYNSPKKIKEDFKLKIAISGTGTYYIETLEFFKASFQGEKVIPLDQQGENVQGLTSTTYKYYSKESIENATTLEELDCAYSTQQISYDTYRPVYNVSGEKFRSVKAKESNYFNILQSIAETFECWMELYVDREEDGTIKQKVVRLKNYAGGDNYAAFRYGVNLKGIQRTYESKNIVTKLVVKQNSNDLANNGFCSIARTKSNPTGENYIYDFQYFQNAGLMSAEDYISLLYRISSLDGFESLGTDLYVALYSSATEVPAQPESYADSQDDNQWHISKLPTDKWCAYGLLNKSGYTHFKTVEVKDMWTIQGYFPRLRAINDKIIALNPTLSGLAKELVNYKSLLQVSEAAVEAATSGLAETLEELLALTKRSTLSDILEMETKSVEIQKLLKEYSVFEQTRLAEEAQVINYKQKIVTKQSEYSSIENTLKEYYEQKEALNRLFYETYSRFIQEGTWISEEYMDDEKYYIDAQSVMYDSCYPQVAYTINTIGVDVLPDYQLFKFDLGDKTYVEDTDFFGYEEDGSPKREKVIIAEISENLDDPSKNTNKVQNFKNQFQDLFQKITATAQSAQYNAGVYAKGAALAQAIDEHRAEFLTNTLDEMTVNLTNKPVIESTSIDGSSAVKIIDGKILFSIDGDEGKTWAVGMSSKGVSANKITAGQIDTSQIQIMNGLDPAFVWDSKGITAYDWTNYDGVSSIDPTQFVRFDKYGLYGIKESNWIANSMTDVEDDAIFALTWEGLKVVSADNMGTKTILRIGNGAKNTQKDDTLLSVISVKDNSTDVKFAIKNDGTIEWGEGGIEVSATVDYDSIWSAFNNKKKDERDDYKQGIYPFEKDGYRWLGINASLINTGSLRVGGEWETNPLENAKLYADMTNETPVYLAGWWASIDNLSDAAIMNESRVGLHSGQQSFSSLAGEGQDSPIRFYAGAWEDGFESRKVHNLSFISNGEAFVDTITLNSEERLKYKIVDAKYEPRTIVHKDEHELQTSISPLQFVNNKASVILEEAYPLWVPANMISVQIGPVLGVVVLSTIMENGKIKLDVTAKTQPLTSITITANISYTVEEKLNIKVSHDENQITMEVEPITVGQEYSESIEYILDLRNQNYKVLADGSLYANNAKIAGSIEAEGGNIGNWSIDWLNGSNHDYGKGIYVKTTGEGSRCTGMGARGASDSVAFWAGCPGGTPWEIDDYESIPFYVKEDGTVCCSQLNLTGGTIDGEVNIIQATIGNTKITGNSEQASLRAQSGSFVIGGAGATITFKQGNTLGNNYYIKAKISQSSSQSNKYYFQLVCVDDNNNLIASPITISGEDLYGIRYRKDIERWRGYLGISLSLAAGSSQGNLVSSNFTTGSGEDYVNIYNDSSLGSGVKLNTDSAQPTTQYLLLSSGRLNTSAYYLECGLNLVPDVRGTASGGKSLGTPTEEWYRIYGYDLYYTNKYDKNSQSDIRVKNSIEPLDGKYDCLFDKMSVVRYKYNEGNSNRYHTGFIAQQLVTSLEESGLTTQDFAGVVLNNPGEEDECWYLRRDEFVALNTWQIQKLKPRVSTLEQTIVDCENRISKLETEIQNLKSQ